MVNGRIVGECLKNIICLSLYIEEYLELPNIGNLISDYWYEGGMLREDKLLADFFEHHKVSGDEAINILKKIIHSNINDSDDFASAVGYLCDYAKNETRVLNDLVSAKQLQNFKNIHFIASFCKVATKDVKQEIIDLLRIKIQSFCQLVEAECFSEEKIITEDLLKKHKDTFKVAFDNNLFPEEWALTSLLRYTKEQRQDLMEAVDSTFLSNPCYQFFRNPLHYSGSTSSIKGSWLLYIDDQDLTILIRDPQIRQTVKQFYDDNPWSVKFKKKIWEML